MQAVRWFHQVVAGLASCSEHLRSFSASFLVSARESPPSFGGEAWEEAQCSYCAAVWKGRPLLCRCLEKVSAGPLSSGSSVRHLKVPTQLKQKAVSFSPALTLLGQVPTALLALSVSLSQWTLIGGWEAFFKEERHIGTSRCQSAKLQATLPRVQLSAID